MKFAHMSDVHLGVWNNHPELKELPLKAFEKAVDICISEKVDFIVISGDFFDTSMPPIDVIKFAVEKLRFLKESGVQVYVIAGSHDYSPTGKTMLNVLEAAGLMTNTHMKMVEDRKTGTKIFGIEGLRGGLDKQHYDKITSDILTSSETGRRTEGASSSLSNSQEGFKIFMFHSAIKEYSIPMMESVPLAALPRGFDYYANGHIHVREEHNENIGKIVFPGPIFPCDFAELEKIKWGSFVLVDVDSSKLRSMDYRMLRMCDVELIQVEADGKSAKDVESSFMDAIDGKEIESKIVLLKSKGTLKEGKPSDIDWKRISALAKEKGAVSLKKSVHLSEKEAEIVKPTATSVESIETEVIESNSGKGKIKKEAEKDLIAKLMEALNVEKAEDEKVYIYEEKIKANMRKVLGI